MHNVFTEFFTVTSISDQQSLYTSYMAKLQRFPPVWTPATTFFFSGHLHTVNNQSGVLHAWTHGHKTIPLLLSYGADLTICCCKEMYSLVLLVDKCEHLINLSGVRKEISLHAAVHWTSLQTSGL